METLAFLHSYVDYEDPRPAPQLRSLKALFNLQLPSFAWIRLMAIAITLTILTTVTDAIAAFRYGDAGADVTAVQQALIRAGHDPGPVDGVYGGATEYAVLRFQQTRGLAVDGIAGPATLNALGLSGSGGGGGAPNDVPYIGDNGSYYFGGSGGSSDGGNYFGGGGGGGSYGDRVVRVNTYGSALNVRSGPGLGYGVLYALPNGATASTTGQTDSGWVQLLDGGWVAADWVY